MAAEKNFENRLKKFLESEGCWFVKFFANGYTKQGIPDILCCCNGYFIGIEVKAPNGKPSELQKMNIRKINQCNGFGVILYPDQFDDFKEMIQLINGCYHKQAWEVCHKINERWVKPCK